MKIIRERPCQRLNHRVTAPLYVAWAGETVRATDWSLSGLRLDGVDPAFAPDDDAPFTLALTLPFQGFDVSVSVTVSMVRRVPETCQIAVRFVTLDDRARNLLSHFVDELVRGSMVEVEDTIQRIDVPVTPVSTTPDPNPKDQVPVRRWPVKTIVMTAVYLLLGLVVLSYGGLVITSNFFKLEVQTAVVSAPLDVIVSHGAGTIDHAGPVAGDPVREGDTLMTLVDHDLEHRIDVARIALDRAMADRDHAARLIDAEARRTADHVVVAHNNRARAAADILALQDRLALAVERLGRRQTLLAQGHATADYVAEAADLVAALEAELENRRVDFAEFDETASNANADDLFDMARLEQTVDTLTADLDLAQRQVDLAGQELAALEAHRLRMTVYAPFDGRIVQYLRPSGGTVRPGDALAVVEQSGHRVVDAFVNQEEILLIGLGDTATVYLPSIDAQMEAMVVNIDRTTGFVDEVDSAYTWRGPDDRSGRVTLQFADNPAGQALDAGLPAIVIFDRRNDDGVLALAVAWAGSLFGGDA